MGSFPSPISQAVKQGGDSRARWCQGEPKVTPWHVLPRGRCVCIPPLVRTGAWPPSSSGLVPLRQTPNGGEPEREPEACPVHFDTLKLPSAGLLALMSFSFSLCLFAQVCPLPPMVSHGDYICHPRPCERYNHGTVVEFYCDPGYTLTNDYKYITCQYGEWFPSYQVYCVKTGKGAAMALLLSVYSPSFLEQICWSLMPS